MTTRIASALSISALLIIVIIYVLYGSKPACTLDTDCTAPQTCVSGTCKDPAVVPAPEVYVYDEGQYMFDYQQAVIAAAKNDASVATNAQLSDALAAGADWCWWGWLDGGTRVALPLAVNSNKAKDCQAGGPGEISYYTPNIQNSHFGTLLYGIKPQLPKCAGVPGVPCTFPFNDVKYSKYS